MSYVLAFGTIYQRECSRTGVFRVAPEEEKDDILNEPFMRTPLVSQRFVGLTDWFGEDNHMGSSP